MEDPLRHNYLILISALILIISGGVVDTIYFDFAKALDSVPHERLLAKLKSYDINGKVFEWIKDFLSNHRQIANVNGMKSDPAIVSSRKVIPKVVSWDLYFSSYI